MSDGILPIASSLKNTSFLSKYIDSTTKDIIKMISNKITSSNRNGLSNTVINIPTYFNYSNMNEISNSELQLIIYNKLISYLEEKKYSVKINMKKDETSLSITWGVKKEYNFEQLKSKLDSIKN